MAPQNTAEYRLRVLAAGMERDIMDVGAALQYFPNIFMMKP
jgi:hypothetical protein